MAKDKDQPPLRHAHGVVAPGGWCTPTEALHDIEHVTLTLPVVSTQRGGIDYTDRRTEAEKAADQALVAYVNRVVGDIIKAQDAALLHVAVIALAEGYDVHIQRNHLSRFLGLALEPRRGSMPFPTIREHPDAYYWEDDDD